MTGSPQWENEQLNFEVQLTQIHLSQAEYRARIARLIKLLIDFDRDDVRDDDKPSFPGAKAA